RDEAEQRHECSRRDHHQVAGALHRAWQGCGRRQAHGPLSSQCTRPPEPKLRRAKPERPYQRRPAAVISSVTLALSRVDWSTFGASSSAIGGSAGFAASPLPMAYSNDLPSRSTCWPTGPVTNFRNLSASSL